MFRNKKPPANSTSNKKLEMVLVIIFFILSSYLYLGANIFNGEIVAPMDLLLQYPGWKESGLSTTLINGERSDILDSVLPTWIYARNAILNGELPLWIPARSGGTPGLPFLGSSFFSIGFLIFSIFGGGIGFTLTLLSRLIIAGVGTYKLCRTQLDVFPSIFGGLTYMMCGFNASWLMWPHVETSSWIPWVLLALIRLEDKPTEGRIAILSLSVAMLIFGGFMSVAAYGLLLAGFFAIWLIVIRLIKQDNTNFLKRTGFISLGIVFGFLITSIQLIPFIEWLGQFDTSWRHGGSILNISSLDTLWNPFKYSNYYNGNAIPKVEYTGYVGKIPILFSIIALLSVLKNNKEKLYLWTPLSPMFWTIATVITLLIAFDFSILSELIYKLPVFNNNMSSRLLVLIGLEFSVIGAIGFQITLKNIYLKLSPILDKRNSKKIILIFLSLIIITAHASDLARVGKSQNVVVSDSMFYPSTATIKHVSDNIKPGQHVLATGDAYLISGTLTGYGISELFAHGYFKNSEKKVLDEIVTNAWKSPTAASFKFDQINLKSNLMDKMGIRYILTSNPSVLSNTKNNKPAPSMPSNKLGQTFNISESTYVSGVRLLMATYGEQTSETDVKLSLFDSNGKQLAFTQVDAKSITDNSWINFNFNESLLLQPDIYMFEVEAIDKNSSAVTIWSTVKNDNFADGHMIVNEQIINGDLSFELNGFYLSDQNEWKIYSVGNHMTVYENIDCPPGAYVINDNKFTDGFESNNYDYSNVKLINFSSNIQTYSVQTNSSCWFVRTARIWPGWQATVNGKNTEIKSYMNILPAVKLEKGESIIQFKYRPTSFFIGSILSFASLIVLILIVLYQTLRNRKYKF